MKAKHLFYTLFIFLFSLTSCENEANNLLAELI